MEKKRARERSRSKVVRVRDPGTLKELFASFGIEGRDLLEKTRFRSNNTRSQASVDGEWRSRRKGGGG